MMAGPAQTATPARVFISDEEGRVYDVDASEAQEAYREGFREASKEQVDGALKREQFGTIGQQVQTGVERAVGSATFGASDFLAAQVAPEVADDMRARAEVNRRAATIGTVAGFLAPGAVAKLTKGAGAIGAAAEGLSLPMRGVTAAGGAAEALAARAVGSGASTFLGRAAQRAVPMAVRAGVEGAAIGVGQSISEQSLGEDHELVAEKLWAAAKDGFLTGAAIGGGIGVAAEGASTAGRALKKAFTPKDIEALAARQFGESAPGLGEAWVKATSVASGKDANAIRQLGVQNLSKEAREARRIAVFEGDSVREQAARAFRQHVDDISGAGRNLSEEWAAGLKPAHVEKLIAKDSNSFGSQMKFAWNSLDEIESRVSMMRADPAAYGEQATLRKIESYVKNARKAADTALEQGSHAQTFTSLDQLKRELGRLARPGKMLANSADVAVTREVRDIYETLRVGLEDEAIWGGIAKTQREVNASMSKWIDTKQLFEQRLTTELGRDPGNPWVRTRTADPSKIDGYVNGLTNAKNDLVHTTVRDHITNTRAMAKSMRETMELTPSKLAEIERIEKAADAFEKTLQTAEGSLTLVNQLKALEAGDGGALAGLGGVVGGLALGGPLGAVAGAAAGALARPGQAIRQLAALERLGAQVDQQLTRGVESFAGKAVKVSKETAREVGRAARRVAVGELADRNLPPRTRYDRAVAALQQESTPDAAERRTRALVDNQLAGAAPKVSAALAARGATAVAYLQSKAPRTVAPSTLAPTARKPIVSDIEMDKFLRRVRAAKEPLSIVHDMNEGRLTREAVATVKTLAPKLYDEIVTTLWTRIGELAADGKELPYVEQVRLSTLLGAPTHPTLEPRFVASIQTMHQQARGAKQAADAIAATTAPKRKISTADSHMSATERALENT